MSGGVPRLTRRERDVLDCMARGLSVADTAKLLWVAPGTIKSHRKRLYAELGVKTALGAVAAADRHGLLNDQPARTASKEHSTMNDPIALAAELHRTREALRATEFDLGQERQQNVVLLERLTAEEKKVEALRIELRMIEAARRIPAQPPDPDGGLCDPIFREKPVRDVGSVDTFEEPRIVSGPDSVTLTEAVLRGEL